MLLSIKCRKRFRTLCEDLEATSAARFQHYLGKNSRELKMFSTGLLKEWIKLHNKDLNGLYCSPHIVLVIQSIRIRLAGHVARMGYRRANTGFWWRNLKERDHFGDPGVDGRIT